MGTHGKKVDEVHAAMLEQSRVFKQEAAERERKFKVQSLAQRSKLERSEAFDRVEDELGIRPSRVAVDHGREQLRVYPESPEEYRIILAAICEATPRIAAAWKASAAQERDE